MRTEQSIYQYDQPRSNFIQCRYEQRPQSGVIHETVPHKTKIIFKLLDVQRTVL